MLKQKQEEPPLPTPSPPTPSFLVLRAGFKETKQEKGSDRVSWEASASGCRSLKQVSQRNARVLCFLCPLSWITRQCAAIPGNVRPPHLVIIGTKGGAWAQEGGAQASLLLLMMGPASPQAVCRWRKGRKAQSLDQRMTKRSPKEQKA